MISAVLRQAEALLSSFLYILRCRYLIHSLDIRFWLANSLFGPRTLEPLLGELCEAPLALLCALMSVHTFGRVKKVASAIPDEACI